METNRLKLQKKLETLCPNVYFQPPDSVKLKYPCIIYHFKGSNDKFANNHEYISNMKYDATLITQKPNDPLIISVSKVTDYTRLNTSFIQDQLNHYKYTILL